MRLSRPTLAVGNHKQEVRIRSAGKHIRLLLIGCLDCFVVVEDEYFLHSQSQLEHSTEALAQRGETLVRVSAEKGRVAQYWHAFGTGKQTLRLSFQSSFYS